MRFDPFTPDALADPYAQYARFRAEAPVHRSDKLRSWVLFRHDDVAAFFRDDERLSSDRSRAAKYEGAGPRVRTVASDPPEHVPLRSVLNTSLAPRVRSVRPRVTQLVDLLLAEVAAAAQRVVDRTTLRGEVDLIEAFAYPLPIRVICELFDVPEADRRRFQDWSHAVARGMDRFYSGDEMSRGFAGLHDYFTAMVRRRRGGRGDDLVHRLLAADHHGERLTEDEVIILCSSLVFGGHETTVNLIGNGLLALFGDRRELERWRADPALSTSAVEELLRFDSPAQLISRTAVTALELRGQRIAPGETVLAAVGAANRDPDVFAAPDRLDLGREPNPHLAFGAGTHFCPGALLTRIEARVAIPALLRRFPALRPGRAAPARRPTAVLRGLQHLPARVS